MLLRESIESIDASLFQLHNITVELALLLNLLQRSNCVEFALSRAVRCPLLCTLFFQFVALPGLHRLLVGGSHGFFLRWFRLVRLRDQEGLLEATSFVTSSFPRFGSGGRSLRRLSLTGGLWTFDSFSGLLVVVLLAGEGACRKVNEFVLVNVCGTARCDVMQLNASQVIQHF